MKTQGLELGKNLDLSPAMVEGIPCQGYPDLPCVWIRKCKLSTGASAGVQVGTVILACNSRLLASDSCSQRVMRLRFCWKFETAIFSAFLSVML